MPAGSTYKKDGPPNATYSSSESGIVDREIYAEWFQKNFLTHASKERPLLLLQDGAAAHISPTLIDLAIANDVILLCFPPKLTHILQPCDVAICRTMKAELSKVMHQVKMLRGDCWISKHNFPAIFKTFTAGTITESFRKCGIFPLNRDAISKELIQNPDKQDAKLEITNVASVPVSTQPECVEDVDDGHTKKSSTRGTKW